MTTLVSLGFSSFPIGNVASENSKPSHFKNSSDIISFFLSDSAHLALSPLESPLLYESSSGVGVRTFLSRTPTEGALLHVDALLSILPLTILKSMGNSFMSDN